MHRKQLSFMAALVVLLAPLAIQADPDRHLELAAGAAWESRSADVQAGVSNRLEDIGGFVHLGVPIAVTRQLSIAPTATLAQFNGTSQPMGCPDCFQISHLRSVSAGLNLDVARRWRGLAVYLQGGPQFTWQTSRLDGGLTGQGDSTSTTNLGLQASLGTAVPLGTHVSMGLLWRTYANREALGTSLGLSFSLR